MRVGPEIRIPLVSLLIATGIIEVSGLKQDGYDITSYGITQTTKKDCDIFNSITTELISQSPFTSEFSKQNQINKFKILNARPFFLHLLDNFPSGYQIDIIDPITRPRATRRGILNVQHNNGLLIFDYRPKSKLTNAFLAEVEIIGDKIKTSNDQMMENALNIFTSPFDKNGCIIGGSAIDLNSKLRFSTIRSLKLYDKNGNPLPKNR